MVPPPPNNVRQLFKQQQTQRQQQNKIDHVFAKYDSQGKLGCVLCKLSVKNEQLWGPHLQSAKHKQLLAQLKTIRQQQQQKESSRKRPAAEQDIGSAAAANGDAALLTKRARFEQLEKEMEQEEQERQQQGEDDSDDSDDSDEDMEEDHDDDALPADFFDTPAPTPSTTSTSTTTSMKVGVHRDLPSGFFDDANEEAKARQVDAPDVLEDQQLDEDYAAFKEMMVDTNEETDKMLENDEETVLLDREVTLAHQQLALDQKVQHLRQLRQQPHLLQQQHVNLAAKTATTLDKDEHGGDASWTTGLKSSVRTIMKQNSKKQAQTVFDDDMDSDDDDIEEEEEDNWRAQHV